MKLKLFPALWLTALLAGCSGTGPALPPIPEINTTGMLPPVQQQIEQAVKEVQDSPRNAAANGRLGVTLLAYEEYDTALGYLQRAATIDRDDYRWQFYFGYALAKVNRHDESLQPLRAAADLEPELSGINIVLAQSLDAVGRADQARKQYERALATDPARGDARYGLGKLLQAAGDTDAAIEQFERTLADGGDSGLVHYALANAYISRGDSEKAEQHLQLQQRYKSVRIGISDPLLRTISSLKISDERYIREGKRLFDAGKVSEAAARFNKALELNPSNSTVHANLVGIYSVLQQPGLAEKHYRAATEIDSNLFDAHMNYATMLFQQRRLDEAVAAYRLAIDADPTNVEALVRLGFALGEQGNGGDSVPFLRRGLELDANHPLGNYLLGRQLVSDGQLRQGIVHLERSVTASHTRRSAVYLHELASAYQLDKQPGKALETLQRARQVAARYGSTAIKDVIEKEIEALQATDDG
ncbi:MAG: tetratricopeptide repeat protein [Gammaproteobacteria bacterium]|nr:tetratricopeptide repeat protein [Gammaproteobacteria bacterium]NNM21009.1 tetratricopeptide repeat protein [Gammaproteobacteria bacterium]